MAKLIEFLPELEGDEALYIARVIRSMDEETARRFSRVYRARRKDPQTVLLTAVPGFLLVAGIHRFIIGQTGMGILYLLTFGLCGIGTFVDLINYRNLAFEYNREVAQEVLRLI